MTTFSVSVADAADNGNEIVGIAWTDGTPDGLGVGDAGSGIIANAGMRFVGVTVPQGATINSAQITTYNEAVTGSPAARWYAWDTDDAGQFSFGGDLPSNVTKTTAFTTFTMSNGDITHSITSVIQEIVNRAGWVSGNAINMVALNNASPSTNVAFWDAYDTGTPALLEIDYTAGGGSTAVPVFMNHLRTQGIA